MPANSATAPSSIPNWLRFLFPSVSDIVFLVLLFSLSAGNLAPRLLGDAGIGWHIRNGQLMLQTHAITRADPFSSTMQGQPWYAWEWLYDLIIAGVHNWLGLNGVVLFTAIIIAATLALAFRTLLSAGAGVPVSILLILLSAGASTIHFLARPHVLSWLFVVVWFRLLESYEANPQGKAQLIWLPALMLIWANLHGGFLIGLVLLALYLIGKLAQYATTRDAEPRAATAARIKHVGMIAALAVLASFANPYGYKLHVHVYHYLSNRFLMDHIDEFLSPNFHGVAQQCFAMLLLITVLGLAVRREKVSPFHLLVIIFAVYSGLYASRNLPVSSLLLTLVMAPLLTQGIAAGAGSSQVSPWLRRWFQRCESFASRMSCLDARLRGHLWPVLIGVVLLWACTQGGRLGPSQLMSARFDSKRFPVQAAEVIVTRNISGPIFCPDNWGGYLIYRLYPQTKVAVDDRHDLYGEQFFKDYLKLVRLEPGWEQVLNNGAVNWVLVPADSTPSNALQAASDWQVDYRDQTAMLFQRRKAGNHQ